MAVRYFATVVGRRDGTTTSASLRDPGARRSGRRGGRRPRRAGPALAQPAGPAQRQGIGPRLLLTVVRNLVTDRIGPAPPAPVRSPRPPAGVWCKTATPTSSAPRSPSALPWTSCPPSTAPLRVELWRGQVAIVTVSASGIGLALAERFVSAGLSVVLADVEKDGWLPPKSRCGRGAWKR